MPQTVILDNPLRAYAGQLAEAGAPRYARSKRAEGAGCSAGTVVLRGSSDEQAVAISDGATVDSSTVSGVVLLETSRALEESPPADGDDLSVLRLGVVYLEVTASVSAGDPLYVGNATAQLGDIAGAAGTGLALVPGCRFLESAGVGELAAVMINLA